MVVCQNDDTSCWCKIITIPKNQIYTENKDELGGIRASLKFQFNDREINHEQTTLHCSCHFPLGTQLARYLKRRRKSEKENEHTTGRSEVFQR